MNIVNSQHVRNRSALIRSLIPVKPFRNLQFFFFHFYLSFSPRNIFAAFAAMTIVIFKVTEDSTDTTCCVPDGDPLSAKQHHWKSEEKEHHQSKQQTKELRSQSNKMNSFRSGPSYSLIHRCAIKDNSKVTDRDCVNH